MSNTTENAVLDTFKINSNGIFLKEIHIQRSLEALALRNKIFSVHSVAILYDAIEKANLKKVTSLGRLVIDCSTLQSNFTVQLLPSITEPVRLEIIRSLKQTSGEGVQNYKWADRAFWNQLLSLKASLADDVLSVNEKDQVVETSRFNIFFYCSVKAVVFTPPLTSGCIHGTYRRWALQQGFIELPQLGSKPLYEKNIFREDIKTYQLFVANSVRGVLSAVEVSG